MRYGGAKKRRDLNEPAIIDALRKCGVRVVQAHMPGFCDLVTYSRAHGVVLLEVKGSTGTLTKAQKSVQKRDGWPIAIVRTVDEALHACGQSGGDAR